MRRYIPLTLIALVLVMSGLVGAQALQSIASPANAAEPVAEVGKSLKIGLGQVFTPTATVDPTLTATPTVVVSPTVTPGSRVMMTPTATLTPTATSIPVQVVEVCRLDKIGTFAEIEDAGQQRIEVGGHTDQHFDYYPYKGVLAISYIIPAYPDPNGIPGVWWGFGSIWQGPDSVACSQYDWLADTEGYARARTDSGHSGVVVDMRSGSPVIVINVGSLSDQEAMELLELHMASWGDTTNSGLPAVSCDFGQPEQRVPEVGVPWQIDSTGFWTILNGWTNEDGHPQSEWKLLLHPDDPVVALLAGGSSWSWDEACEQQVLDQFAANPLPEVTLAELEAMGLLVPNGP